MNGNQTPSPSNRDDVPPGLSHALSRELADLPRPDASSRPALRSFREALRAVEARELARLGAEEESWRPRIQALPGPAGEPLSWPRLRRVLGLDARRRLVRMQGFGAALAAAALVLAALLGQQGERSEWELLQASARPVEVILRIDDLQGDDRADGPAGASREISPWSLPGGAP